MALRLRFIIAGGGGGPLDSLLPRWVRINRGLEFLLAGFIRNS
jgi:hypothetical protein